MFELYKIKHPYYEQYSAGLKNGYLQKTKKGKTFNSIGALKNHLKQVERFDIGVFNLFYDNWLVIKITESNIENLGIVKNFH